MSDRAELHPSDSQYPHRSKAMSEPRTAGEALFGIFHPPENWDSTNDKPIWEERAERIRAWQPPPQKKELWEIARDAVDPGTDGRWESNKSKSQSELEGQK